MQQDEFGKQLRKLRARSGKTLKEVYELTGIPVSTLSYMESGTCNVEMLLRYQRLATVYGATIDNLLEGQEIEPVNELHKLCEQLRPEQINNVKLFVNALINED